MEKSCFLAAVVLILAGCSNLGSKTQSTDQGGENVVIITNDLENAMGKVPGWMKENTRYCSERA